MRDRLPRDGERAHRLLEQAGAALGRECPRRVQRAAQQRAGAGRLQQGDRAVHDVLVEPPTGPEVEHGRLGEAADDLVGAGDDEVRVAGERMPRQRRAEREMGAPCLVHDQGHSVPVRHPGKPLHVGNRAEVGGGHDHRSDRAGRPCERAIERLGRDAMRDAELRVDLRGHEDGPQAGHDEPVDRARVDVALHDDLLPALCERHACRVVALRGAVDQEPCAAGAPRLRGQLLRPLERCRLRAGVDALRERRDVELQRSFPERICQHRVRRGAALVTGDVQAPRRARGVCAQRVEIGRLRLHAVLRHRSECREG